MGYRVYICKKAEFSYEAKSLFYDLKHSLSVKNLSAIKVYHRYDIQQVEKHVADRYVKTILLNPQTDELFDHLLMDNQTFILQNLSWQFDLHAAQAAQCIQYLTQGILPKVECALVVQLVGDLQQEEVIQIQNYLAHLLEGVPSEALQKEVRQSQDVGLPKVYFPIQGFCSFSTEKLQNLIFTYGFSFGLTQLQNWQAYFSCREKRDPTLAELYLLEAYWLCLHPKIAMDTPLEVEFGHKQANQSYQKYLQLCAHVGKQPQKFVTLAQISEIINLYLQKEHPAKKINAPQDNSIVVSVLNGKDKKEQTRLGFVCSGNFSDDINYGFRASYQQAQHAVGLLSQNGFIPLQAMRLSGVMPPSAYTQESFWQTKSHLKSELGAAAYFKQIGLSTGHIAPMYHRDFLHNRLEVNFAVGILPAKKQISLPILSEDVIILLWDGFDRPKDQEGSGIGYAQNSQPAYDLQKKIKRLLHIGKCAKLIKKAVNVPPQGIGVALCTLGTGVQVTLTQDIQLCCTSKADFDLTNRSVQHMAVVVRPQDAQTFIAAAGQENLSAIQIGTITNSSRVQIWVQQQKIVDLSLEFINFFKQNIPIKTRLEADAAIPSLIFKPLHLQWESLLSQYNVVSQKGLTQEFDTSVGGLSVSMPFSGSYQNTPTQTMATLLPSTKEGSKTACITSWGYDPELSHYSPYYAGYYGVVHAVAKLVAGACTRKRTWLNLTPFLNISQDKLADCGQDYHGAVAGLLGALEAQLSLEVCTANNPQAILSKKQNYPKGTLAMAMGTCETAQMISSCLKQTGSHLYFIQPQLQENGLYDPQSLHKTFDKVEKLIKSKKVISAWATGYDGVAGALSKMAFGSGIGIKLEPNLSSRFLFGKAYGGFVVESPEPLHLHQKIGITIAEYAIKTGKRTLKLSVLEKAWNLPLQPLYKAGSDTTIKHYCAFCYEKKEKISPLIKCPKPKVLIPVIAHTTGEIETQRAFALAGAKTKIFVLQNRTPDQLQESIKQLEKEIKTSQIICFASGFSSGAISHAHADFIVSLLQNKNVLHQILHLLEVKNGLMCGIGTGFQALVKVGLLPFGKVMLPNESSPLITSNPAGKYQSGMVYTRISSIKSPWMMHHKIGEVQAVPFAHGEGRFWAQEETLQSFAEKGQILTQYVDLRARPTSDPKYNPNRSAWAIEGLTSPDGKILGKMSHCERVVQNTFCNVPKATPSKIFQGGVEYFK